MSEDRRDVLQVLRYELNFLEQGGYGRGVRQGMAISPFQDTLSCLNFGEPTRPHTCRECLLYDFVPQAAKTEDVPCHFIQLNDNGVSVEQLLRSGDHHELETALKNWLRRTIKLIEAERIISATGD